MWIPKHTKEAEAHAKQMLKREGYILAEKATSADSCTVSTTEGRYTISLSAMVTRRFQPIKQLKREGVRCDKD